MKIRHVAAMLAAGVILGGLTGLTRADAQTVGDIYDPPGGPSGCFGNQRITDTPYQCQGARDYRVQGVSFTVSVIATFDGVGTGTADYTLSRTLPQPVPIRVRSHSGVSSSSGPLIDDVSGVIPAGSTTARLTFMHDCGQVDIKAVFTAEGDSRGRLAGPYVCWSPPSTVPDTAPTTAPGSTVPSTTLPPGPGASSPPTSGPGASSARVLPATGNDGPSPLLYLGLAALAGGAWIVVAARRRADA